MPVTTWKFFDNVEYSKGTKTTRQDNKIYILNTISYKASIIFLNWVTCDYVSFIPSSILILAVVKLLYICVGFLFSFIGLHICRNVIF